VLPKEDERGAGSVGGALLKGSDGNQGRGGPGSVSAWRREKEIEWGLARRRATPAQSRCARAVAHGRAETGEAGDTDRCTRGHSNGWHGQNGLNHFKIQTV
jgi:hypothetical protein